MYFKIRRIFDFIISLVMILILLPIMVIISVLIKIDSKGPVIFKQERIGKDGKNYYMYKFRTMVQNAENIGTGVYSFQGDSRITKVGKILRKTSLDELPQLFNIIKGEMAFVGPRSPVYGHFPQYNDLQDIYKKRFQVPPGITGLAQCVGRNELTWDEKIRYDNEYIDKVRKFGFLFDCKIWMMTFKRVLSMENISETQENMEKNMFVMKKMVKTKRGDINEI